MVFPTRKCSFIFYFFLHFRDDLRGHCSEGREACSVLSLTSHYYTSLSARRHTVPLCLCMPYIIECPRATLPFHHSLLNCRVKDEPFPSAQPAFSLSLSLCFSLLFFFFFVRDPKQKMSSPVLILMSCERGSRSATSFQMHRLPPALCNDLAFSLFLEVGWTEQKKI